MLSLVLAGCVTLGKSATHSGPEKRSPSGCENTRGSSGVAANAQPLPWHTEYTADAPRLNSDCRIPRLAPAARPPGGWEAPQDGPHLCREGEPPARPSQLTQVMGSKLRVRAGAGPWVENFIWGQAWALPPAGGQVGGGQFAPRAQGLTPCHVTPAGGRLEPCYPPARLCTAHPPTDAEVPLPYPHGHALPLASWQSWGPKCQLLV